MYKIIFPLLFSSILVFAQNSEIEKLDDSKLNELVQNRYNKLLVINYWATWCIPCKEEIPDFNKLYQKYGKQIDIIGVSIDFTSEVESRIKPFIKENKVQYKIYVNNFDKDENLINYFDQNWSGALPATYILDEKGEVIKFIEGKTSFESLEQNVEDFL